MKNIKFFKTMRVAWFKGRHLDLHISVFNPLQCNVYIKQMKKYQKDKNNDGHYTLFTLLCFSLSSHPIFNCILLEYRIHHIAL